MEEERKAANFIEAEINKDIENHVYANDRVLTRFPPEPNGYLHIGHVKSICLNFGIGQKYHGETNVRFDDTNPAKEEVEYVNSILEDVKWLGFHWKEPVHYASDYFPHLHISHSSWQALPKYHADLRCGCRPDDPRCCPCR